MKLISVAVITLLAGMYFACEKDLNRGLQEEKSYTRAAMEKYRQDPSVFRGSSPDVLEIWSRADYVATAVARQKIPGNWARTTDTLNFLQPDIQRDTRGKPFCVIQEKGDIVVLRMLSEATNCATELLTNVDTTHIRSGDMEFSGRTDYWVFVLRPAANP